MATTRTIRQVTLDLMNVLEDLCKSEPGSWVQGSARDRFENYLVELVHVTAVDAVNEVARKIQVGVDTVYGDKADAIRAIIKINAKEPLPGEQYSDQLMPGRWED